MYKIMIKHNPAVNKSNTVLWKPYGTTTSTASAIVFKEFETDDVAVLEAEILKLCEICGHENIKVYSEVTTTYLVDVTA